MAKNTPKSMGDGWEIVTPPPEEAWEPAGKGEVVEGRLVGFKTVTTKRGTEAKLAQILSAGKIVTVWQKALLKAIFTRIEESPGVGCEIRIIYLGQSKPTKKGMSGAHEYEVQVRGGSRAPTDEEERGEA